MNYFDNSLFGSLGNKNPFTSNAAWGSGEESNGNVQQVQSAIQQFTQSFQNLTGRAPTQDEIGGFAQNALYSAWNAPGDLTYSDSSNLANNYIQNTFGPQIAQNQKQQQTNQLGDSEKMIQDLIQKQTASTASDISNPNSPTYQSFAGNMNNLGITPSSGAFQAGLGGTLGTSASNSINAALGSIGLPTISGIQGLTSMPFNFAQGNSDLGHLNSIADFGLQSSYADMLNREAQPSGFEKGLGYANTSSGILKNLTGSAQSAAAAGATWICTAMWKKKILAASEVDRLHAHLFKSFFKRFWKFLQYFVLGKFIVFAAEYVGIDWDEWRPLFYDRVIAEPDSTKAVDLYGESCWTLVQEIRNRLKVRSTEKVSA